jgi:hypothetical protein
VWGSRAFFDKLFKQMKFGGRGQGVGAATALRAGSANGKTQSQPARPYGVTLAYAAVALAAVKQNQEMDCFARPWQRMRAQRVFRFVAAA